MTDKHYHTIAVWANSVLEKLYRRMGKLAKSAERLQRIQSTCGHPLHAYDYGNILSRVGELNEANKILESSSEYPNAPATWLYRHAMVLERLKRYETALGLLEKAAERDPRNGEYRYRSGVCLAALGKHDRAFYELETAIDLNPHDARAAKRITRSLPESVPLWRRLAVLDRAIVSEPNDRELRLAHARSAYWIGDLEKAVNSYRRTGETTLLSHDDAYLLAVALDELDEESDVAFTRAIATSNSSLVKRLGIGALHEDHRDPARAITEYLSEWENGKHSAERAFRIGMVHERLYRYDQAAEWFGLSIDIDPSQAYRQYKFALNSERIKQYQTAIDHYRIAASLSSKHERYWKYRAGVCSLRVGNRKQGLRYLAQSYGGRSLAMPKVSGEQNTDEHLVDTFESPTGAAHWRRLVQTEPRVLRSVADSFAADGYSSGAANYYEKLYERTEVRDKETTLKAAQALETAGCHETAEEILLCGRDFRRPDGLNVKVMTKNVQDRRNSLYAEYVRDMSVKDDTILYESYWGTNLSCHPLAIYREIRQMDLGSRMKHVWVLQNSATIPDDLINDQNVIFVTYGSDKYLKYLATAKYLINNTTFVPFFTRRDEQRYMNTWHGTPLKTLGRSVNAGVTEHANITRNLLQATHILAPNEHTRNVLLNDFDIAGISKAPVKALGSPRLDRVVLRTEADRDRVRAELGISADDHRRIVLYAPTWRGTNDDRKIDIGSLKADLTALEEIDDYIVLFRGHHLTEGRLYNSELRSRIVTRKLDTYTLLQAVDVLVTDYSSLLFDYLVTDSRVIAYVPDEEEYSSDRGLYYSPSEIVTEVARNRQELCDLVRTSIDHVPDDVYTEAKRNFVSNEDGESSRRAVDFLFSDLEYNRIPKDRPVVAFFSSLYPNGITSALRDLINAIPESEMRIVLTVDSGITSDSAASDFISQLERRVQIVTKNTGPSFTLEERQAHADLKRWRSFSSDEHRRILRQGFAREFRRLVGDASIDSVMQFEGYSSYWTALFSVADSLGARSSIYLHNEMQNELKHKYPYLREIFQWVNDYDTVATVSRSVADENEKFLKQNGYLATDRNVYWLRNVIDVNRVRKLADIALDDASLIDHPLIVSAGRLSYEKNHELLLHMMPSVLEHSPDAKLVIMGDGPLRNTLEGMIVRLGLSDNVFLLGHVMNPYPYIRRADVFVLPSLHEGQPVVLYEAIALGTPFVAAPTPGTEEVAESVGACVVPANAESFAAAVLQVALAEQSDTPDLTEANATALSRFQTLFVSSER